MEHSTTLKLVLVHPLILVVLPLQTLQFLAVVKAWTKHGPSCCFVDTYKHYLHLWHLLATFVDFFWNSFQPCKLLAAWLIFILKIEGDLVCFANLSFCKYVADMLVDILWDLLIFSEKESFQIPLTDCLAALINCQ